MSNIAGALYRVTKIKNEMKCSRRMRSVSRQYQFKQPCLQAAPEGRSDGASLTAGGRLFQARAAATGTNSRSQLEVVGEVRRCRAVQTLVDQHT